MDLGHVLVHVFGLDLKEKAVSVRVEVLAALSVLRFELVVIEVVHQVLGAIQNAHAHIHRSIEYQVALVDLDSCEIIVKDIGPSKCWAGDEAPEFVLLMRTHQLHINSLCSDACPETCIAADSDSEAHSGPCNGGLGPASQRLSAPPQRLGGYADILTAIFSEPPCAPVPADMHCSRCVGLLGTTCLPRV